MSEKRITQILERARSFNGTAVVSTPYSDDAIVAGSGFVFEKTFAISAASTLNILIDYTTYLASESWQSGLVYVMPPVFSSTYGVAQVHIYRGTDYTGGVEFDCINPNTTMTKSSSDTTFTTAPTGTDKGTEVLSYVVGTGSTNQSSGGAPAAGITFFIRPNTSKTLVEIVNESGEDVLFHYSQVIYEI